MSNKTNIDLDIAKIKQNKKIYKQLQQNQEILISAKIIKINHVNKRQQRILVVTNKNIYNIASPSSFFPNRIKRKIPLFKILSLTVSRFGNQVVINIEDQDDYRFFSPNLNNKYIQTIIIATAKLTLGKVKLYQYDDLSLQNYTTTIIDIQKKQRKNHKTLPLLIDQNSDRVCEHQNKKQFQSLLLFKSQSHSKQIQYFQQFQIIKVLGRGAFGKVMLCKHKSTNQYFAVKSMRKQTLIQKQSLQRTKTQRFLLQKVNHPFLINIQFAFQTKQKIFLIMKFYRGGEMFSRLRKQTRFTEDRAKFYAAQVFLALQYLHNLGYAYRDLKPQNILFDSNGYIKVSDYGLAKQIQKDQKSYSITGTPSYLSPQVILNQGHSFSVDWWALGILIYEMIFCVPPFYHREQRQMFKMIINKPLQFPKNIICSEQCKSLLRGLLQKYPKNRLGSKNDSQIKNHAWFKNINWDDLVNFRIKPQYIPAVQSLQDVSNFHEIFTKQEPINTIINIDSEVIKKFDKQFVNFDFNRGSLCNPQNNNQIQINQCLKRQNINQNKYKQK